MADGRALNYRFHAINQNDEHKLVPYNDVDVEMEQDLGRADGRP
jgi:hypothetical protein